MVSKGVIFGAFLCLVSSNFLYFGGLLDMRLVIVNSVLRGPRWLFTITYPTCIHGIIVKYPQRINEQLLIV